MKLSRPIFRLKRNARLLARREGIALHLALDRIAMDEGYANWSLLAAQAPSPAQALYQRLSPGDLVLLAARPGQGKTLMGLALAVEAARAGHRSVFFSLEYAERDVRDRLVALGADTALLGDELVFDGSDDICADYAVRALAQARPGTLAVVDYLQLLDQKRTNPPLDEQVGVLQRFARERETTIIVLSQVDRSYDPRSRRFPDVGDIRRPNPFDPGLFTKTCFMNAGKVQLRLTPPISAGA